MRNAECETRNMKCGHELIANNAGMAIAADEALLFSCKDLQGTTPDEIQVIPYGYHRTPKGNFLHDEESQRLVMESFAAHKKDMVIDYEHQTLSGGVAPAAGWVKRINLVNRGTEGLWARVDWTTKARAFIANREYRYVSPVFLVRESDRRVIRLINVALTNEPNIDGMVPLVNKAVNKKKKKEVGMLKKILARLGLSEDAGEDAVMAAVNKLAEGVKVMTNKGLLDTLGLTDKATADEIAEGLAGLRFGMAVVANKSVLDALGLEAGATEAEVTGTIMAMKQAHGQAGDLSKTVAALTARIAEREAGEMVNKALDDGKVTPAQKEWAEGYAKKSPEEFRVFISKAPVIVPVGQRLAQEPKPEGGHADEATLMVAKTFGNSEDDLKKYGGLQRQV